MRYRPGPDDEVLGPCERRHVGEGRLDERVGSVAQEVPEEAGVGRGLSPGGGAHLGGVRARLVGRVQVEVRDVPEPAWKHGGDRDHDNTCYIISFTF